MKKVLEQLWYEYQTEEGIEQSEEEKELIHRLVQKSDVLRAGLSEKQKYDLEQRDECQNELCSLCAKEAFIKGVRFATGYLLEAIV